jgi:hypothetical protein
MKTPVQTAASVHHLRAATVLLDDLASSMLCMSVRPFESFEPRTNVDRPL